MRIGILNELKTAWAGKTCLCFPALESTNDYAKELAREKSVHGTLIVADTQTAGKGRRGRVWQSPAGTNIAMSLCMEPALPTDKVSGVTLVAALAAAEAIFRMTGETTQIKWPNDLVLNGRKICGILTELCFRKDIYTVVVGIGINVNTEEFPEEIKQIASSLKKETGKIISREKLIAEILKCFEEFYACYEKTQDFSLLRTKYEYLLANKDREVLVLDPAGAYHGIAKGITDVGNLVVVCEDGSEREVYSGEVSVRGLYGYV